MGRKLHFRAGSFYRTDDRTGFPTRAERTRKEWDGLWVDQARYEERQPQDFVRGVRDQQSVPEPRPLAPNAFVGPISTTLTAKVAAGVAVIPCVPAPGMAQSDPVAVVQADGSWFRSALQTLGTTSITLAAPLPFGALAGALIYDMKPSGAAFATRMEVVPTNGAPSFVPGPGVPANWKGD